MLRGRIGPRLRSLIDGPVEARKTAFSIVAHTRGHGGLLPHQQPEHKNMGDQRQGNPQDWDEITRQQSRRVRKREAVAPVKRIQQVGSPKDVADPEQKSSQSGPESGERVLQCRYQRVRGSCKAEERNDDNRDGRFQNVGTRSARSREDT